MQKAPNPLLTYALAIMAFSLLNTTPATATCYSAPFPACPNNDSAHQTLLPDTAFPEGDAGRPMAFVDPEDGSRLRFVPLQGGEVRVWSGGAAFLAEPFLDISDEVRCCGEQGLLALAFHPDYETNGYFYVKYVGEGAAPSDDDDIVIERYQRSAGSAAVADPSSGQTVLIIDHEEGTNHNGGWLAFGPDGYLYVSTGDGGSGCDNNVRDGQNPSSLRGKILRLDIDGDDFPADPDRNYAIPSGNPYVAVTGADEVWALGLRNPFRFSFDRDNGDLFIGDVGQRNWEEINYQAASTPAPVNFGWVCREGCATSATGSSNCTLGIGECSGHTGTACEYPTSSQLWDPILCFQNVGGGWESIIGGYRYRGDRVPSLADGYLFVDAAQGEIWQSSPADLTTASCWDGGEGGIFAFGEDHVGELYLVYGYGKRIDCIAGDAPGGCYWAGWGGFFEDGFESGNTTRWSATEPPLP